MPFSRARYGCAAGARYWRVGCSTVRTPYAEQSARYREPVAGSSLDKLAQRAVRDGLHVDLRRILLRPTEETARRNGHPDIRASCSRARPAPGSKVPAAGADHRRHAAL
ncbi:DUF664 domain-containing protein [Streptomyces sp. SP2-10]|uniref:mycothiol transferase n=1 Tax=Streptomyces sp. SP2-10 TaxID=2873385 RepID=UPI0035AC2252